MEIIIKKKSVNILETLGEKSYKVEFKNKVYLLKKFEDKVSYQDYINRLKYLRNSGILVPKIVLKDKKQYLVLVEFFEGKSPLISLKDGPLDEVFYKNIFHIAFTSKFEGLNLDFKPDNFLLVKDKLVYLSTSFKKYKEEENFVNTDMRLWFYTKEFSEYLKSKGLEADNSRIKPEYEINKEIVLTTIKYYL